MPNTLPPLNLLSNRSDNTWKQPVQFWAIIISASVFSLLIIIIVHFILNKQLISYQQESLLLKPQFAAQTQSVIYNKDLRHQKEQLVSELQTINILLADNQQTKTLLEDLSHIIPAGVYLTGLTRENQNITISGKTVTAAQLSTLIANINKSDNLMHPEIDTLISNNQNPPYTSDFDIQLQLKIALPTFMEQTS